MIIIIIIISIIIIIIIIIFNTNAKRIASLLVFTVVEIKIKLTGLHGYDFDDFASFNLNLYSVTFYGSIWIQKLKTTI